MPDGRSGRGATYWWSGRQNTTEQVVIEFDRPERVSRLIYDVEELRAERTQPVTMEPSTDGGETYRAGFVQEYTFSPNGSTYQRELELRSPRRHSHEIHRGPSKGGAGTANITSLRLFG
jgi:hypothetical protein